MYNRMYTVIVCIRQHYLCHIDLLTLGDGVKARQVFTARDDEAPLLLRLRDEASAEQAWHVGCEGGAVGGEDKNHLVW